MILMNDFKRSAAPQKPALVAAFSEFVDSGYYILGTKVAEFEKAFASISGTKHVIGVANGLEALQISLLAHGVGVGDEVITVANTAIATTLAITQVGATPVFVDVDQYALIDVDAVKQAITKKTKAIVAVDLFGQAANWKALRALVKNTGILLVEDACQATGAQQFGKPAGSLADIGCFSFYPTKNLGALGDGGAIATNSDEIAEKCRKIRNYGQSQRYYHDILGINSRLDELQAALLLTKLPTLQTELDRRQEIGARYTAGLSAVPELKTPKTLPGNVHSFHLYAIETPSRDALQAYLREHGVESLIHYPVPIHQQQSFPAYNTLTLPNTERLAQNILSLPIHPHLTNEEVDTVIETIKAFFAAKKPTVTIGIPAHNEERSLPRLLKSILTQDMSSFSLERVVVLCDGCTDNTEKVAKKITRNNSIFSVENDGKRLGQAARLHQLMQANTSDIFVTFDADTELATSTTLAALVAPFQDDTVALVGGNNLPKSRKNFLQSAIAEYELCWRVIIRQVNGGNNVHNCPGCVFAIRGSIAKMISIPQDIVANDHAVYFLVQKLGHRFVFAPAAKVWYEVPSTLSDFLKQTTRFLTTKKNIEATFTEESEQAYAIPSSIKLQTYLAFFRNKPILFSTSLALQLVQRGSQHLFSQRANQALWESIKTSK